MIMTRLLFLPLQVQGLAPGANAAPDVAVMARWLPEIVSRLCAGSGMQTGYARMVGRTQTGQPTLLTLGRAIPDEQARSLAKQHGAAKTVAGSISDGPEIEVRLQVIDQSAGSVRLVGPIRTPVESLHQLPRQIADELLEAVDADALGNDLPAELDFDSPLTLQSVLAARDVVVRLDLGIRPQAAQVVDAARPFFDLAIPQPRTALAGLISFLGRLLDPRTPQLAEPCREVLDEALDLFGESAPLHHLAATYQGTFARPPAFEDAETSLERAMELDPDYLPARFSLADFYRFQERFDDESALYEALADHEKHGTVVRDRQGVSLAGRGQIDAARDLWHGVLEGDATFTPCLRNLALSFLQEGRSDEAMKWFEKAVQTPERLPIVLFEYGSALVDGGEPAQAVPYLQRHLRTSPNHLPSLVALGSAHRTMGDNSAARDAFQRAAQLDPKGIAGTDARLALYAIEEPEAASNLDQLTQNIWDDCTSDTVEALSAFLDGHTDLDLWHPWYALGIGHRTLLDWNRSAEALERAATFCPGQPDILAALGTCHLHFGRVDEGAGLISSAFRARPQDPSILTAFGLAHHLAGKLDDAERLYRRSLDLAPDDAATLQYLDSLDSWRNGDQVALV